MSIETTASALHSAVAQPSLLDVILSFLTRTFGRAPIEQHDDGIWTSGARGL
jgi:hypothetical protein